MDLKLDFRGDFRRLVEETLMRHGVAIDPDEPYGDAVYRLYANRHRRIAAQPYEIKEPSDLRCPPEHAVGYAQLKDELTRGVDVEARLSRQLEGSKFEDPLLNDWGITHFHLGVRTAGGRVRGTNPVLFAYLRGSVVHCIGFFDHALRATWVKTEMLEILQRNWPEAIEHARARGVTGYDGLTDEERLRFRYRGANIITTVNGSVYGPLGGGTTAAGTSMNVHRAADAAMIAVDGFEEQLRLNIAVYLEELASQGLPVQGDPVFEFGVTAEGKAVTKERSAGGMLILGDFPP